MGYSKTPSGVPGLDELLGGGIPAGRVVLVVGEPGAGKTILCSQFLNNGIQLLNEPGIFVSLEEGKTDYLREMKAFGWEFEAAEAKKKFLFIDASPIRHAPGEVKIGKLSIGKKEFSLASLIETIRTNASVLNAKRITVDPASSLAIQFSQPSERRTALLDLVETLSELSATCLVATELSSVGLQGRRIQLEEYVAHGVILMQTLKVGRTMVRTLQVEKMRENPIDRQPRPYRITEKGIEVYPRESVF